MNRKKKLKNCKFLRECFKFSANLRLMQLLSRACYDGRRVMGPAARMHDSVDKFIKETTRRGLRACAMKKKKFFFKEETKAYKRSQLREKWYARTKKDTECNLRPLLLNAISAGCYRTVSANFSADRLYWRAKGISVYRCKLLFLMQLHNNFTYSYW